MDFFPSIQVQYKIVSALNKKMVLDCNVNNQNSLIIWEWHGNLNQRWNLQKIQKNIYRILNTANSKTITSPTHNQGQSIKCKLSQSTPQEKWQFIPCKDNYFQDSFAFYIKNLSSGKVLDVYQGIAKNGQPIIVWDHKLNKPINQLLNQIWLVQPVSFAPQKKTSYKIFSPLNEGLVMDSSKNPISYNTIILWNNNKQANQKFYIQRWKGKYLLINKQSDLSVQVSDKKKSNQASIITDKMMKQPNQLWDIIPCQEQVSKEKTAYYIRSFCGKYLDIINGQALEGKHVIQWDFHGNSNQKWFIQKF